MKTFLKAVAVVTFSAMLGVGSVTLWTSKAKSQPVANPPQYQFRSGFIGDSITNPEHGIIAFDGAFQIGYAAPYPESREQRIEITDSEGNLAVSEAISYVDVKPGESQITLPYSKQYQLAPGVYHVHLFSHRPGDTNTDQNGVVGRAIMSDVDQPGFLIN